MTRLLTYSLTTSLDGYVVGPDGRFDWAAPDEEVFRLATDEVRGLGAHLMGRRLHESMLFWEDVDPARLSGPEREFRDLWRALPKVVLSRSLAPEQVRGSNTRLATGSLTEEVERLRAEPGTDDLAVGGAQLGTQAAHLGLLDEYRIRVLPVLVGGGTAYFAHDRRQVRLELLESRPVGQVQYLRYRVLPTA
ncbi:dihydrofolate reductase family protein [Nocardioides solisilvae]|uniref:dihydrofolate reductase family protein n=1 Tax=Nocardioides solisilvae TaxID=1542435 RepID=UPI000D74B195|nr:dihydrofolate reductase family protein [Nocardioides solisilvae]